MRSFTRQGTVLLALVSTTGFLAYAQIRLAATHDYQSALNRAAAIPFCGRAPVGDSVQKSVAVVKASVVAVTEKDGSANVLLSIDHVFAGTINGNTLTLPAAIAGQGQDNSSGDLHFASGQPPYLLFLRKTAGGEWRTSRCYGSRMLKGELTAEEQQALQS